MRKIIACAALALSLGLGLTTATPEPASAHHLSPQDQINLCNWFRPYGQGLVIAAIELSNSNWVSCVIAYSTSNCQAFDVIHYGGWVIAPGSLHQVSCSDWDGYTRYPVTN